MSATNMKRRRKIINKIRIESKNQDREQGPNQWYRIKNKNKCQPATEDKIQSKWELEFQTHFREHRNEWQPPTEDFNRIRKLNLQFDLVKN